MKLLNWLKGLLTSGSPVPRITYRLPQDTVFKKFYNKDILFKDMDWSNWNSVIEGFRKRIEGWCFANMAGGHASYLDLCSLCALVEVFLHYDINASWHEQKNYKEFLRRLNPIFRKQLAKPIVITRFYGAGWVEGKLKDFADVFYAGVRCSLHHHGDLASYAGMSGSSSMAQELPNAGTSVCGTYRYSMVVFDPDKLRDALHDWFTKYCDELKANPTFSKGAVV